MSGGKVGREGQGWEGGAFCTASVHFCLGQEYEFVS